VTCQAPESHWSVGGGIVADEDSEEERVEGVRREIGVDMSRVERGI